MISGGDKRDRTADLLRARQALSQLSYIPISSFIYHLIHLNHSLSLSWWALSGLEPPDLTLIRGCAPNHLSYRPKGNNGFSARYCLQYINQSVWTLIVSRFW